MPETKMSSWRRYDELTIGDRYPEKPAAYVVAAEFVRAFRSIPLVSRMPSPGVEEDSPDSEVPPMLAGVYTLDAQRALGGPPGGIQARQNFAFHAVVQIGDVLETTVEIRDKFERKGRRYVVCDLNTTNQQGLLVATGQITHIWGPEN